MKISYEFYPDSSETTYLLSLILFKEQKTTLDGLSFLEEAIQDNSWEKTEPFISLRELGRVYLQIGLFDEALGIFNSMGIKLQEDMFSAILKARTLVELYTESLSENRDHPVHGTVEPQNNGEYAFKPDSFLADSLKRFPLFAEFYILYAEYLDSTGKRERAHEILDQGLEKLPGNSDLILAKVKLTEIPEQAVALLDTYFKSGGVSPEAYIWALILNMENRIQYLDLFFEKGGNRDILLLDKLAVFLKADKDLYTLFKDKESYYTGTRVVDKNRDGFFEELYTYDKGNLIVWQSDRNQDGLTEIEIEFKKDTPAMVLYFISRESSVNGKYSTYPYLESLTFINESKKSEYLLLPLQYPFALFPDPDQEEMKYLAVFDRITLLPEEEIKKKAFRENEFKGEKIIAISELLNGEYVTVSRDTDRDGSMDHIIEYKGKIQNKGKRDLDGDGNFEILEHYTNGRLIKITYDYNNDNHYDCTQLFDAAGRVSEAYWDYNSDGIIDAKENMIKKDEVVFLFSTGYDGTFDLHIVFRRGRVVSAKRGNEEIAILAGNREGLYWIGKRGKNPDMKLFSGSGLYYNNGIMYFIFKYRDSIYIEELK